MTLVLLHLNFCMKSSLEALFAGKTSLGQGNPVLQYYASNFCNSRGQARLFVQLL